MFQRIFLILLLSSFSIWTMEIKLTVLNRSVTFAECCKILKSASNKKDIEIIQALKAYSLLSEDEKKSFDKKANKRLRSINAASTNITLIHGAINWK